MDEATASVDNQTDDVIQKVTESRVDFDQMSDFRFIPSPLLVQTIQTAFANVTLLIIAHRLSTVVGCDKILALDSGKVAEYVDVKC